MDKIAVVTGGNRGIGKEIVRQLSEKDFKVILGSRDVEKGLKAVSEMNNEVEVSQLDINKKKSIIEFAERTEEQFGQIDVLVNNAGIIGSKGMLDFDLDQMRNVIETNFWGAVTLTKHLFPLLRKSDDARIINVSSGMGDIGDMQSGGYAERRICGLQNVEMDAERIHYDARRRARQKFQIYIQVIFQLLKRIKTPFKKF